EPGRERDPPRGRWWGIAQVENHQAEASALNQQVGGFECMFGIVGAAHPEEAGQGGSGCRGIVGGEGVLRVHQGTEFFTDGSFGEDRMEQRGASGGGGSHDFGKGSARESARGGIDFRDAGRNAIGLGTGLPGVWAGEEGCELVVEGGSSHFRFLFAYT